MSRILLVSNTSWYLYNFRLPFILELREAGYHVSLVAPHDAYTPRLEAEGLYVHDWSVSRRSINPILEFKAIFHLIGIYASESPDLVHHFTVKACLYGTVAAKVAHVYRVVNAVTGLGHLFLGTRKRSRLFLKLLKPFYRATFSARRSTVIFQNADDQERLIKLGMTDSARARLIRGSGVDINYFRARIDNCGYYGQPLKLLFPSRLIREKGTVELLSACRSLWDAGIPIQLVVAGATDIGNRSSLSELEIEELIDDPRIHLLGHVNDMRSLYESSDIVVLPSWREGLSRALIEAAAMERPIITTDVPGCRDVVDHGISGILVPVRDPRSLELAIRMLVANPSLARQFGQQARRKVLAEFQVSLVNQNTLNTYRRLLSVDITRNSILPPLL